MIESYIEKKIRFGEAPSAQELKPGDFWVLIDDDGKVESVDFLCPCGCGSECYTPVVIKGMPKLERHWVYESGPTLTPSIRYLSGCKAHFNITNGKAIMHGDSGK